MPISSRAEFVMAARDGEDRGDLFGLVEGGEQSVRRHLFFAEFQPFTARATVIIPIELRMIGQDLQATPYQEENAQDINEVIDPEPNWETKVGHDM